MAQLSDDMKAEIVTRLAQFEGASDVARAISAEFDVVVDRFQVRSYDPTKPSYAAGDRWQAMFASVRRAYLNDIADIPIAQKCYRLNELQKVYESARSRGNLILANATLEQAAKEAGGALTNHRDVKVTTGVAAMNADERRAAFAELIRKALNSTDPSPVSEH